jgi:oxidase EvaA
MSLATLTRHGQLSAGDPELARRFTLSARTTDSTVMSNDDFNSWFGEQRRVNRFEVTQVPFSHLRGWQFRPDTGDLVHESGRFFAIEGLSVRTDWEHGGSWMQPIINQAEIGVLGIVVKEFGGVLHFLMQAKMEPGNINTVQLSPTVQATRSNYAGVHGGRSITHLEYFTDRSRATVLVDVLQSEQGAWFLRKRNRNMLVEVTGEVPEHPEFCWLTLGQIQRLLRLDNVVNMDARTVLSCIPLAPGDDEVRASGDGYQGALLRSLSSRAPSLHSDNEILHWLTQIKAHHELVQRSVPLDAVERWHRSDTEIAHETGKYFKVIAAEVTASNREVTSWTQPLVQPMGQGMALFFARPIDGVLHLLVHAKMEAGVLDVAELAPTVQCLPGNYADLPPHLRPRHLDEAMRLDPARLRYSAVQSEEGGRFHNADNRYQVVDVGEEFPLDTPEEYRWMTPRQVMSLLLHSYYVNVQARSLFACLQATW